MSKFAVSKRLERFCSWDEPDIFPKIFQFITIYYTGYYEWPDQSYGTTKCTIWNIKYSMTKWIAFCNSAMTAHGRALSLKWILCTVFFSLIRNPENAQNYASIERLYTFAIFIIENQHITNVVFTHRDFSVMQQHFCHAKKYAANCNKKSGLFACGCILWTIATSWVGVNPQKIESCK